MYRTQHFTMYIKNKTTTFVSQQSRKNLTQIYHHLKASHCKKLKQRINKRLYVLIKPAVKLKLLPFELAIILSFIKISPVKNIFKQILIVVRH